MPKIKFEQDGKVYKVYGRAQHIGGNYQPHIYEVETKRIPDNQMRILKKYLISNNIPKEELEAKTTYELVYMTKKHLTSK